MKNFIIALSMNLIYNSEKAPQYLDKIVNDIYFVEQAAGCDHFHCWRDDI